MANSIMHILMPAMLRPRVQYLAPAYNAYVSYALSRTMLSGISGLHDDCGIFVLADTLGMAQGSSVPIFRGGPPI